MTKVSPSYRFTQRAEHDLEEIIDYTLQQWGAHQTNSYIDNLEDQCRLLADNPRLGVRRDEIRDGLFSFPYESHILYYVMDSNDIVIVRVLHQGMDPMKHL